MEFLQSECFTTLLIVTISIIVFVWFVYPMLKQQLGDFDIDFDNDAEENFADTTITEKITTNNAKLPSSSSSSVILVENDAAVGGLDPALDEVRTQPNGTGLISSEGTEVPYYNKNTSTIMSGTDFKGTNFESNDNIPVSVMPPNSYLLDDGNDGKTGVNNAMCSKSCCAKQWPVPFKTEYDSDLCSNTADEFVPTNITCNNGWSSGCACVTKNAAESLSSRGGNA